MSKQIINYVSRDEVNGYQARWLAEQLGVQLRMVQRLTSTREPGAAVLYDGDSHPQSRDLLDGSYPNPTAFVGVHGYTIDEDRAAALRDRGVVVSKNLEGAIRGLVEAMAVAKDGDTAVPDAAAIGAEVRAVAAAGHRLKGRHEGDGRDASREWERLEMRIGRLQEQLEAFKRDHQLRLDELSRWLDNLRRLVQAHGRP